MKNLLYFLGLLVVGAIAFILLVLFVLSYYKLPFLVPVTLVGGYISIWILHSESPFTFKNMRYPLIVISTVIIGYTAYLFMGEYERSIPKIEESYHYSMEPFKDYSQIARLESKSNLKLTENLPRLDGVTEFYPLYSAFVNAVYDKDAYSRNAYSQGILRETGHAYERLLNGEVDIIFVPLPSKEHQLLAEKSGKQFHLTAIGQDALVFFVNSHNPVDGLTIEQIQRIYSGKIKNWTDIGGENDGIRPFQRAKNSGSQAILKGIMKDIPLMDAPREEIVKDKGGIVNQVADYRNYSNALGFSFLIYSQELLTRKNIKLLKINGIEPNHQNIRNKSYPFSYDFYAVTLGNESEQTRLFIEWMKSKQGQELVEKTGYISLQ